jgi:hypothetical protein
MNAPEISHELDASVSVRDGGTELLRYVYRPDTVPLESPKPYIHPLRTRAGRVVSLFRPHDHTATRTGAVRPPSNGPAATTGKGLSGGCSASGSGTCPTRRPSAPPRPPR